MSSKAYFGFALLGMGFLFFILLKGDGAAPGGFLTGFGLSFIHSAYKKQG